MQMYKVFVNDHPIIFVENDKISTNLKVVDYKSVQIVNLIEDLFHSKYNGVCLKCSDLKEDWKNFKQYFKIQKAAGGKVLKEDKVLFIYRFNKWDLPKGKLEKGEAIEQCAVREVEEECGIDKLKIEKQIETTYHIFKRKNKTILKITYWFLMKTDFSGNLIPQTEEGIERVAFKNEFETMEALENTYENIKLLF
jgi:ADP-ribose pyrophosphatase YjhB (NUDIX family)